MKRENPIYQRILEFLEKQSIPVGTNFIAGAGIWPEQYLCSPNSYRFSIIPGKEAVSSAYYYLKNLEKQGKVKQVYKGAWRIVIV